ncbi:MAG TPA: ImmA/IrrE family metallo-endopeptidase [Blastocatellia bacterium]|nr:ImmA/IrrE family metallo-endopeptidase [Blastocatellia bacterium]
MSSDNRQQAHAVDDEMLPPSAKRRVYERIALKIREFAGMPLDQPLDPWKLAPYVKIRVMDLKQIEGLSEESRRTLLDDNGKGWSGGASRPLPDGSRLVFLNPNHTRERQAATLMEEICHVILGHSPTKLMLAAETEAAVNFRNFDKNQEEVAFAVGAAALVPYFSLKHAVSAGLIADRIARRYGVSRDLVEYRIKVCSLWPEYKQKGKQAV